MTAARFALSRLPPARAVLCGLGAAAVLLCGAAGASADDTGFDCVINPAVTVQIGSPVAGLIDKVLVGPGDLVRTGEAIATLRSEVERTSVALAAEQAQSTAEIEAQRARLDLAQSKLERTERLVERKITTREELETARAEMEVTTREVAIAELRQRLAVLELQRAREQLAQRTIRSPLNGVVVERMLYDGEFLYQDARVMTIAQMDPLIVEAFLPARLYYQIVPGAVARVEPREPVTGSYEGHVTVVDRVFDAASSTFGVRVELANPELSIPAGHRCRVSFPALSEQR